MNRNRFTLFILAWIAPVLLLAALATAVAPQPAHAAPAATLIITNLDNSGAGSLRQALDDAVLDDIIEFDPSLSGGTIILAAASPLAISQDLTIRGNVPITISGNDTTRVFEITGGHVVLDHLHIINGNSELGGGILATGTSTAVTLTHSTVAHNRGRFGSGIRTINLNSLTILHSSIVHNQTRDTRDAVGGGLYCGNTTVTIENSTFANNQTTWNGGAIGTGTDCTIYLRNSTIADNTADSNNSGTGNGGGISIFSTSRLYMENSIIADNTDMGGQAPDCALIDATTGFIQSQGHTLIGDTTGCVMTNATGDILNADSQLLPLGNYGGPTWTMRPTPTSPAIDAGNNATCPAADQRDQLRTDYTCDIGAVEVQFSDSDTISKTVSQGNTYTFGPTLAKVQVVDDGDGCLTGISIQRVNSNHPQALNPNLQTGVYWDITGVGCDDGFTVTLTLPHSITPDSNAKVCKFPGTQGGYGWDCFRTGSDETTVWLHDVGSFSDWAVGAEVGPTAVSLQSLAITSQQGGPAALAATLLTTLSGIWLWARRLKKE